MRRGIVRKGNTTTLYGREANDWLVRRMCDDIDTIKQAEDKVFSLAGAMQESCLDFLDGKYFENTKGKLVKFVVKGAIRKHVDANNAQREEEHRARAIERGTDKLRSKPVKTAKGNLRRACTVCDGAILKGQSYRMTNALRVHNECL